MISMVLHKARQGDHFRPGFPLAVPFRQLVTQVELGSVPLWNACMVETGLYTLPPHLSVAAAQRLLLIAVQGVLEMPSQIWVLILR